MRGFMEDIPITTEVREKSGPVAETTAEAVNPAGERLDAARQYVIDKTQQVKESFNQVRDEGLEGLKARTTEYTRRQPFSALLIAFGAGVLLSFLTRRRP
jgi:ElaB/YqjD/DUF883 family membrane-anchored ribosome-binding protein